ncbi:histidine kinase [Streptomyces sp. TG1A-8]|uniref:sensor histidine kinase n=1 Tax=Streptomyces sp. TG1A-8 TaxID=3051385 RepID=UPI00265BF670|nr:histidine kinase [Streptomyces sp. TG1A-8]MDO0926664.1 histidine kinase [Streptomyces sp. TG1A-8]
MSMRGAQVRPFVEDSGGRSGSRASDHAEVDGPGLVALGTHAPPPRFALAVVFTVMTGFFAMQVVDILDEGITPVRLVTCVTVLPLTIVLQVAQTLPRLQRLRDCYGRWVLAAQVLLVVVPCLLLGWAWGGMGGFVGASALLVLPMRGAVPVFGLIVLMIAVSTGITEGFGTVAVPYMIVSTLLTGIIVYSLIRLATLAIAVHEARDDFARIAITKERLRFARDLHDLLGYSLSAITLKGELAYQLVVPEPERAREELQSIVATARQALADVREVARSYRSLSLLNELSSARSVLSAAGIEAHVKVDYDRLVTEADTALATVVREGVTNVVRHSKATRCRIEVTQRDGVVSLRMDNDGVQSCPAGRAGRLDGCGLESLTARMAAVGGYFTAGPTPDGGFRILAETAPA